MKDRNEGCDKGCLDFAMAIARFDRATVVAVSMLEVVEYGSCWRFLNQRRAFDALLSVGKNISAEALVHLQTDNAA